MVEVITSENFEEKVLKASKPVLVDFYADWCGPCKMMSPAIAAVSELYADRITVGKLNTDDCMDITMTYRVTSIPFMALFRDGELVDRIIGAVPQSQLEAMIESHLA